MATSFNEANNPPSLSPPVLIDEFFQKYNQLFFDIPKNGATNSHEYLIKRSSEYVDFQVMNDEMLALIDEINALQAQNLELNQKLVDAQLPKI